MRAAMCREYGGPEVVVMEDIDPPELTMGCVRVRVAAAAVNFPDVLVVADQYQISSPTPFVPGSEFAGTITEVADGVDGFAVGDRVFGSVMVGAFAEEVVAPAAVLTKIPDGVDEVTAAGFGVAHRTAYHSLRSVAAIQPGAELIVLGAGGGVGLAAVQLGAVLGATVTAVASSAEKLEAARSVGATRLINYRDGDLRDQLKAQVTGGADVVIDPVGGELSEAALRRLRAGGRFITVGFASGTIPRIPLNLVLLKDISIKGFEFMSFMGNHTEEMLRNEAELLDLLASGKANPHVEQTFGLEDSVAALRHVGDGKAIGKVIVAIGSR
ncbi:MAG: NADPH:quinone oxidoreductase family protein [Frankiaceae bacterium]|nr:NADPH:quinone oxidoreductase family protein [Frankiaceae bacterium]